MGSEVLLSNYYKQIVIKRVVEEVGRGYYGDNQLSRNCSSGSSSLVLTWGAAVDDWCVARCKGCLLLLFGCGNNLGINGDGGVA